MAKRQAVWVRVKVLSAREKATSDPAWARRAVDEGVRSCPRAGCGRRRSSSWSMVWTAVVGSLIAGDNALIAMSTRSRIGYFGSCSKVRSRPRRTALRSASSGRGAPEIMNAQKNRAVDQRVADCARHHDRSACLPRQRDEGADVQPGDGAGLAEIFHRLGRAAELRAARCGFGGARDRGLIVQGPEHVADDSAPLVADQMEHVADLKVAETPISAFAAGPGRIISARWPRRWVAARPPAVSRPTCPSTTRLGPTLGSSPKIENMLRACEAIACLRLHDARIERSLQLPAKLPRAPPSRASPPQIGARLVVEADVEDHLLPRFAPEEIVQFHVKVGFFTPPLSPYQSRRAAHEAGRATGVSAGFPTPLRALQAAAPSPSASRNQFCTCRSGS